MLYDVNADIQEYGEVIMLRNNVVYCSGIEEVMYGEVILLGDSRIKAYVSSLDEEVVKASALSDYILIKLGDRVYRTKEVLHIPVGEKLLGRVVNALAEPLDELGPIESQVRYPVERKSPQIVDRFNLDQPSPTGIKFVDILCPIAKGQRELILGERKTGKTEMALHMAINRMKMGSKCVYVVIGKEMRLAREVVQAFKNHEVADKAVVVYAGSNHLPFLQVLSAFSGCTIAEYFMDRGEDTIVIYDDLSKHAVAHRQVSLSLRYPPGREAYPGDMFYLHARLLERASCVNASFVKKMSGITSKGGSMTAIPILEIQYGDVSSYICTNVISITDGQLFLSQDIFKSGCRPALNVGMSVSRVGKAAQCKMIQQLSADIKIVLSQFKELQSFAAFASELDATSKDIIDRGKKTMAILQQENFIFFDEVDTSIVLMLISFNSFKNIDIDKIDHYYEYVRSTLSQEHPEMMKVLQSKERIRDDNMEKLKEAIGWISKEFKGIYNA